MVAVVYDTNILIDYLNDVEEARQEIGRQGYGRVSLVTWVEVLVGVPADAEAVTRDFLRRFEILGIDYPVAERAIRIRRNYRLKLPDALIWATAEVHAAVLVTRNTKDFPAGDAGIRVPYTLS